MGSQTSLLARPPRPPRAVPTPLHSTQSPSPEALAAAELLAPLSPEEQAQVLRGLRVALGLDPMPEPKLVPVKSKEEPTDGH